jgi:hypothetical protein
MGTIAPGAHSRPGAGWVESIIWPRYFALQRSQTGFPKSKTTGAEFPVWICDLTAGWLFPKMPLFAGGFLVSELISKLKMSIAW